MSEFLDGRVLVDDPAVAASFGLRLAWDAELAALGRYFAQALTEGRAQGLRLVAYRGGQRRLLVGAPAWPGDGVRQVECFCELALGALAVRADEILVAAVVVNAADDHALAVSAYGVTGTRTAVSAITGARDDLAYAAPRLFHQRAEATGWMGAIVAACLAADTTDCTPASVAAWTRCARAHHLEVRHYG